jgi:hypothetical protein
MYSDPFGTAADFQSVAGPRSASAPQAAVRHRLGSPPKRPLSASARAGCLCPEAAARFGRYRRPVMTHSGQRAQSQVAARAARVQVVTAMKVRTERS